MGKGRLGLDEKEILTEDFIYLKILFMTILN